MSSECGEIYSDVEQNSKQVCVSLIRCEYQSLAKEYLGE